MLPRSLPCIHEEEIQSHCPKGDESLHLRGCAVHDQCTRQRCRACPDYTPVDRSILITGGIGDFLAVESMLTPEERESVDTAYYAAPAANEIAAILTALPNYPRLKNHWILPTYSHTFYDSGEVARGLNWNRPANMQDLSIRDFFPLNRPYAGSSVLTKALANPAVPDRPYVVVVPHSTWFMPAGRAFDAADWDSLFRTLDKRDLVGVVLCRDAVPIPSHPRLIDRQGQLTILESIETLKRADGYLGIDSWCSVLAPKLFPANRIAIKNTWPHGWENRRSYWSPRSEFPFVSTSLKEPTWR